jgi:hypothetical protein
LYRGWLGLRPELANPPFPQFVPLLHSASFSTRAPRSASPTIEYRRETDSLRCPVSRIATLRETRDLLRMREGDSPNSVKRRQRVTAAGDQLAVVAVDDCQRPEALVLRLENQSRGRRLRAHGQATSGATHRTSVVLERWQEAGEARTGTLCSMWDGADQRS